MRTLKFWLLLTTMWLSVYTTYAQLNTTYSNSEVEKTLQYREGNVFQKDFLLFVDMLGSTHPAFSPNLKHPFNIDNVKSEGYNWSKECKSKKELSNYIQSILTQLKDGHSSITHYVTDEVYPFSYKMDENKCYLQVISKEFKHLLKEEITHMNDTPVSKVIDSFKRVISHDNENKFMYTLRNYIYYYYFWESTPYLNSDKSLKLTFKSGKSIILHPVTTQYINDSSNLAKNIHPKAEGNYIRKEIKDPFDYTLLSDKGICYLQLNKCYDKKTEGRKYHSMGLSEDDIEKRIADIPDFSTFLDSMFTNIEKNNITTLVIDVRGNGGGSTMLGDELLTHLKKKRAIKPYSYATRFSKLMELNNPKQADYYKSREKKDNIPYVRGKLYDNSDINRLYGTNSKNSVSIEKDIDIFKGKVIFIQDIVTYSSAGALVISAIDNNIGIVIGSKSGYSPCSYGSSLHWQLPNTGIDGVMSHKIIYRPNKRRCKERHITPNVELSTYLGDGDKCWEWILNNNK